MAATNEAPPTSTRPVDWVPVEQRVLGFDRRSLLPAAIVAFLGLLGGLILPTINHSVDYDDVVRPGDVMALQGDVRFTPSDGWGITSGVRETDAPASGTFPDRAVVEDGDASLEVRTGAFDGDADALLERIKRTTDALNDDNGLHVTSDPVAYTTDDGTQGVIAEYSGDATDGVIAAFVVDGTGIEFVMTGPPDTRRATIEDVAAMIKSVRATRGDQ